MDLSGFNGMSLERVQEDTSTVLRAIANSYKFTTFQNLNCKPGRKDKRVLALMNSLLSPTARPTRTHWAS